MNLSPVKKPALYTLVLFIIVIYFSACKKHDPKPATGGNIINVIPVVVTSINKNSGPYNTVVVITGTGFDTAATNDEVFFNGKPATISDATNTQLTAIVPLSAGSGKVSVSIKKKAPVFGPIFTYIYTMMVTTLAGNGMQGDNNGTGDIATFDRPSDIAVNTLGELFITDIGNNMIRKIDAKGIVSILAGNKQQGSTDGSGSAALFDFPNHLSVDAAGNLFIVESVGRVRKISVSGAVTTLTSTSNGFTSPLSFYVPQGVAVDAKGNIYVADLSNGISKITAAGEETFFAGYNAAFSYPEGLSFDAAGNLYVADWYNNRVRKVTPAGVVTTLAGKGDLGAINGPGTKATFNNPTGLAVDADGNVYVADSVNNLVRKITKAGVVTTYAGNGTVGATNGDADKASFSFPTGVAVDAAGLVYVADQGNNRIRKVGLQ